MIQLLSQIVETSAARSPDQQAFRYRTRHLTYSELDVRSSQLAGVLQEFGVRPGDRVAISMPKAMEMPICVFACLRAGAIYVPVDPALPPERLRYVMEDAGVRAILTLDDAHSPRHALWNSLTCGPRLIVSRTAATTGRTPNVTWDQINGAFRMTPVKLTSRNAAYIIYTSGSTGDPKGILHTHGSGLAYARLAAETYGVTSADRLGNFAPLHFDQSTFEYFSGPLRGATTVLIPEEHMRFPASLAQLIEDEQLTIWYSVPFALIQLLLRGAIENRNLSKLRWVLYGGEPFPVRHLAELMRRIPSATFSNVYGPAEVNQCSFYHLRTAPTDESQPVPIGRVWQETDWKIVDEQNASVARGDIGELLISGPTMLAGYWNQPELTSRAICELEHDGRRIPFFRTGDLVREQCDGNLEFHGRSDRQIKIRGNRVELDEIEAVVLTLPFVARAAALAVSDPHTQDRRVILAAILKSDALDNPCVEIQQYVRQRLPSYAVPSEVIRVSEFPLTTSNKTDYRALGRLCELTAPGGVP